MNNRENEAKENWVKFLELELLLNFIQNGITHVIKDQ